MKLKKEQITYIDDYLKHHKVKHWDIRIELLDHIVTNVEDLMAEGKDFDKALEEVHLSFGNSLKRFWNSGIEYGIMVNGIGYESLIDSKRKETNRKYRKLLIKEIQSFFAKPINVLLMVVIICTNYYLIFSELIKPIKYSIFILLLLFVFLPYYYPIKMWFQKKREKSLNLECALFYAGFTGGFLNLFFQIFSPKGAFHVLNEIQFNWLLVASIPLFTIINYCGFRMYKRTFEYYNNLYEKFQKL